MNKLLEYIKIYAIGVSLSTGFVLISNDLFYQSIIQSIFKDKKLNKEQWEFIKPRQLFGNTAKDAFLDPKHSIKDLEPGEESREYSDYIFKRKYDNISEEELEFLKKDIFKDMSNRFK